MTAAERAELKRVAEAATADRMATVANWNFFEQFDPPTVLRLLADVERLERALGDMCGDFHVLHTEPPFSLQSRQQCQHPLCKQARAALGGE